MIDYQNYFKDKKITLIGLGVLGRGVNLAKFLAELGAELTITDLKKKEELASSLNKLKKFKKIKYVLGRHRLADFKDRDMIIKAASVPFDSEYIKEAEKNKIPVEMDASLLAKLSPAKIIGITGTRGKSTITHFIHFALKKNNQRVFLGGNVRGMATLPLIKEVREKDIIILELDSWQLQGFGDSKISPHIAILTNFFPDHLNYYKNSMTRYFNDKANIFKYQNREDYLIISQQAEKEIKKRYKGKIKSRVIVSKSKFPKGWKTKLIGQHNRDNLALGIKVLEIMGIKRDSVKKAAKEYPGISGRLEFIRNFKGVSYYNDTNASSPEATIAALNSFEQNVILIAGGSHKNLDYSQMAEIIKKKTKGLILIKGEGTDRIIKYLKDYQIADSMKEAVKKAVGFSQKGDIILLSPGAASFGVFKNEYDRGEQFVKIVKGLK